MDTVAKGGNLLVDVGPTKEGTIPLIMQDRLHELGKWLNVNGEAVRILTLVYDREILIFELFRFIRRQLGNILMIRQLMIFTLPNQNLILIQFMEFS